MNPLSLHFPCPLWEILLEINFQTNLLLLCYRSFLRSKLICYFPFAPGNHTAYKCAEESNFTVDVAYVVGEGSGRFCVDNITVSKQFKTVSTGGSRKLYRRIHKWKNETWNFFNIVKLKFLNWFYFCFCVKNGCLVSIATVYATTSFRYTSYADERFTATRKIYRLRGT